MNPQKIKEAQEKFMQLQKNIQETVTSTNGEIVATFDGNVQITKLSIADGLQPSTIQPLLIETINKGIKSVSEKIKAAMMALQREMQSQNF